MIVRCEVCGGEAAKVRPVSRSYGQGEDLFVIENVPVVACSTCGESYVTAGTLHEIERLKLHRHALSDERQVEVVEFSSASPGAATNTG